MKAKKRESVVEDKQIRVSQSAISRFLECRKKARLVLDGWYPKKSSRALRYGSMMHAMLEEVTTESRMHKGIPSDVFVRGAIAKYIKKWEEENQGLVMNQEISQEMAIDSELVIVSIIQYMQNYTSDFNGSKKWLALESKFEVPYKGLMLFGYIDSVYEQKGHHILETKTKSRLNPDLVDILHTDFQTFYYLHGYYLTTGVFPKSMVYNVIRKFEGKLKVNESVAEYVQRFSDDLKKRPEFYFVRIQTLISKQEYDTWIKTHLDPLLVDYKNWRTGCSPDYCNTTNCDGKYGSCDYLPICSQNNFQNFGKKTKQESQSAAQRSGKKETTTAMHRKK